MSQNDPNQPYGGQQYGGQQPSGQQPQYGGQQYGGQQYGEQQYGGQQYSGQIPNQVPPGQMPQGGYYQPQPQKKSRKGCFIILGIISLLVVLCIAGAAMFGFWAVGEVQEVQATVDGFMQAGKRNDASAGLGYMSNIATSQGTNLTEIENLFSQRELFEDYQSIEMSDGFSVNAEAGNNSVATLQGPVNYSSGPAGQYSVELTKENDEWKIVNINLNR